MQLLAGLLDPGIVARQFLKELRLNKCNLPEASNSKRGAGRLGLQQRMHWSLRWPPLEESPGQII